LKNFSSTVNPDLLFADFASLADAFNGDKLTQEMKAHKDGIFKVCADGSQIVMPWFILIDGYILPRRCIPVLIP